MISCHVLISLKYDTHFIEIESPNVPQIFIDDIDIRRI